MNHIITTYGGGEAFYYVFEGIAALMGSQGFMNNLFRLGGLLGICWVFVLIAFRNAYEQAFLWLFWFMTATLVLFAPKATVWIKDPLTFQSPRKVDGVPFVLAAFAGISSSIGTALTEKMESVFTLPDYLPYHETGTVFASKLMMKARQIRITDPEFKANMERFVNRCIVYDAMIGHKYTMKDLQRTDDVWGLVSSKASPVRGFLYREPGAGKKGEIVTCRVGAQKLQNLWQEQMNEAARIYGSGFFRKDARTGQDMFLAYLPQSFQLLTKLSADAPKLLQQEMMINAIRDGSQNKLDELRGSVSYATARALMQQEMNNRTMGEVASEVLVIAKAVIEALCYASFIFVVILSLVHNGYIILWNYAGVLMWLQMWAPLYAVLNLFMTLYGQYRSSGIIGSGLTMMNSAAIAQVNAQVASMAGWLSCSLPFISYAIVKGGVSSFMNIAGNIISSAQSAVSSASSEAASGNFSLGNVSMGTQAYQNTSRFQSNTAPSYRDGSFDQLLDDGTGLITQADGTQVFLSGAGRNISTSSLKVGLSKNMQARAEEAMNHQASVLQSQGEEYSSVRMEAARQVVNLATSAGRGQNSSEGFDTSSSVGNSRSLMQAQKFSKTLQDQYGFSEKQAADITASLMAGTPKWFGIAADLKGSGSSSAGREKTIQDIQQLGKEMGITNSLEEATRSVKDHKFGDSHSKEARLAQDIGHTMEKADSIRSSMTKTQQTMDSYSKMQAYTKTGALNLDRDSYQELLNFAAEEKGQGGVLGHRIAHHILEQGGGVAETIIARFADAKFEQIKSDIDNGMPIQSEADVNALYKNVSVSGSGMKERIDGALGGVSAVSVTQQGSSQGLNASVDDSARDIYYRQKTQVTGEINNAGKDLSHKEQSMQQSNDRSQNRSLVGATVFNAGEGVVSSGASIASAIYHAPETLSNIGKKLTDGNTYTSNFKRPSEQDSSSESSSRSDVYDNSWKWQGKNPDFVGFPPGNVVLRSKQSWSSSDGPPNTGTSAPSGGFPQGSGDMVIVQKESSLSSSVEPSADSGRGSHNAAPRRWEEPVSQTDSGRPQSSSRKRPLPSSTIKQTDFERPKK